VARLPNHWPHGESVDSAHARPLRHRSRRSVMRRPAHADARGSCRARRPKLIGPCVCWHASASGPPTGTNTAEAGTATEAHARPSCAPRWIACERAMQSWCRVPDGRGGSFLKHGRPSGPWSVGASASPRGAPRSTPRKRSAACFVQPAAGAGPLTLRPLPAHQRLAVRRRRPTYVLSITTNAKAAACRWGHSGVDSRHTHGGS